MLIEIGNGLTVADMEGCLPFGAEGRFAGVLHCAKHPCHVQALNYKGSLDKSHPNYLTFRAGAHLILNLIDAPIPTLFRPEVFTAALDFLDERVPQGPVVIHCNVGLSRAPSLALLWLAKRAMAIPGDSWEAAKEGFLQLMPDFAPGKGIEGYLGQTWNELA